MIPLYIIFVNLFPNTHVSRESLECPGLGAPQASLVRLALREHPGRMENPVVLGSLYVGFPTMMLVCYSRCVMC